jgi:AcrR family transcriptional regulator|tara:strand:+ start:499 stop:678 length:180 start_codon:yes stop_codon:yes gene_type:complete
MKNDLVRDHIILSSIKVFKELGYEKVTMNDIARASDKVRSTLYYYFSNKQEVFEQAGSF